MNGNFGIFAEKYYQEVPGGNGVRAITPPPVIGQVYEYTPIALLAGAGNPTMGIFNGFSAFGPAQFLPVEGEA